MPLQHPQAEMILAMAIGSKAIRAAVIDRAGCIRALHPRPCSAKASAADIVQAMREVISTAGAVDAVGVVLPPPDDTDEDARAARPGGSALNHYDLPAELACTLPLRVIHHSNAVLLGEYHGGAARGHRRAAAIIITHRRIDNAMIIDGHLLCDSLGAPAEIIRITSQSGRHSRGPDTLCGRALLARMPDAHTIADLEERARAGDYRCQRLWTDFGLDLADILQPWHAELQPDLLVLSGPVASALPLFRDTLGDLPVVAAMLPDAALVGAAALFT